MSEQNAQTPAAPATTESTSQQTQPAAPQQDKPKVDLSRSFSALSRKEREIRQRETALEAKEKALKSGEDKYQSYIRKLKSTPLEAIQEAGLSYDDFTQTALNNGKAPENLQMRAKIDELEARLAKYEKVEQEQPQAEETEETKAVQEFIQGLETFVSDNSEKYKLIVKHDATAVVYDVIEQEFERTNAQGKPRILSYSEAADMVEQYLKDEAAKTAEELGYVRKPDDAQGQAPQSQKTSGSTQSPTLSNQHSTSRPTTAGTKLLSREESLARAASLLKFT